jgi:hypothetical protein
MRSLPKMLKMLKMLKIMKILKIFRSVCAVCLILGSASCVEGAFLPVTGIFEEAEQTKEGWEITLLVEGQRASGLVNPECVYEFDGSEVAREFFFENAIHQRITVELDEKTANVVLCRMEFFRTK